MWRCTLLFWLTASSLPGLRALDLYVSPQGNDGWTGHSAQTNGSQTDGPLASLNGARLALRKLPRPLTEPVQVIFAAGTYRINQEVAFTALDSGEANAVISYVAAPGAEVVMDGGQTLPVFQATGSGAPWTTAVPAETPRFQQLWVNRTRALRAHSFEAGYHFLRQMEEEQPLGGGLFRQKLRLAAVDIDRLAKATPAETSEAIICLYHKWDNTRRRIESVDVAKSEITVVGGPNSPWNPLDYNTGFIFENLVTELDTPGEWFLSRAGQLTYLPRASDVLPQTTATYPVTLRFLSFTGEVGTGRKVSHLKFQGLKFRHAKGVENTDLFAPNQAAVSTIDGVVVFDYAQDMTLLDCEFSHFASYGLSLRKGCQRVRIEQCLVTDMGAGAIRIGNLTEPTATTDQTAFNTVHNCILRDGGQIYPCAVGLWIGFSSDNTITHNEISDFYYSAISVGWRWGYAASSAKRNRVEYNHLHHLGKGQLSDMGGVYTLGPSEGTSISHNLIHDVRCFTYGGWGLYNDEGSTGITMEGNVCYNTTDGGYHQHYGKDNIVRNNILAFADLYQVNRSRAEDHCSFTFERNIVVYNRGDLLGGIWTGSPANFQMRQNLYWDYSGRAPAFTNKKLSLADWQKNGQEAGSLIADPGFIDAAQRDFRLRPDSPALALGFKPIDTSVMGVTGPISWQQLARDFKREPERAPLTKPTPPALVYQTSFEGELLNVNAPTAHLTGSVSGKGDSLSFSKEHSSDGKQSLKFTDAPGLPARYYPMVVLNPHHQTGRTTCSFDLWLESKTYFIHEWRDQASTALAGPSFSIQNGKLLSPQGVALAEVTAGQWWHFEVSAEIGPSNPGTWTLRLTPAGGTTQTFASLPFRSPLFRSVEWVGFISNADEATVFYLDQLSLATTDPNR